MVLHAEMDMFIFNEGAQLPIPIYMTNWSKLPTAVVAKRKWVSSFHPLFFKFEQNDCQAKLVKSQVVCE